MDTLRNASSPIFACDEPYKPPPLVREASDADGALRFLSRVARPVMRRLESWGRQEESLRALGLAGSGIDAIGDLLDDAPHS
jgi:hypothetical protein